VYVAARIGTAYAEAGYHHLRRCLHAAMDWAARRPPPLTTDAPMSVETVLNMQPGRRVLHLLNFTVRAPFPTSVMDFPGAGLGPIRKSWVAYDEIIPLHDLHVRIPADVPPAGSTPCRMARTFRSGRSAGRSSSRYLDWQTPRRSAWSDLANTARSLGGGLGAADCYLVLQSTTVSPSIASKSPRLHVTRTASKAMTIAAMRRSIRPRRGQALRS